MKVCLVWQRFGPYHLSRLRASKQLFERNGAELLGIEVASTGGDHRYLSDKSPPNEFTTIFHGRPLEALGRREVFEATYERLEQIRPDAVSVPAYSEPEAQAALLWARDRHRIAVVMAESRREDVRRLPIREGLKRAIVSEFDAALAGGSPQARYIHELGIPHQRIFTPYDVVDNEFFSKRADEARINPSTFKHLRGVPSGRRVFLACGRFIERKNFANLIRAYRQYVEGTPEGDPWTLVIIGDGPERRELEALAATVGPRGTITLAGYLSGADIAAYYGLADVFVHPATVEQWGLVVNEAMAAGLPILASTGVGAVEDLVSDGENGFTFAPHDPRAIARAMQRISSSEAERDLMGRISQNRIASWSPDHFARGLWNAVAAGSKTSHRRMRVETRLLLRGSQLVPQRVRAWRSAH